MKTDQPIHIALLGNPNTGKTSVFNRLTGLNQRVGNFPGVTVDLKTGWLKGFEQHIKVVDFPGTYSLYPHADDERVVHEVLSNPEHELYPDLAVVVLDASNLERNLLLFSQIYDLRIPCVMVVNLSDIALRNGLEIKLDKLREFFPGASVCETNARIGLGMPELIRLISTAEATPAKAPMIPEYVLLSDKQIDKQQEETENRYKKIRAMWSQIVTTVQTAPKKTALLDRLTVHPLWGYAIFGTIMLLMFQLIFSIASLPMDLIDTSFADLANWLGEQLPAGVFTDLLTGGLVPGIGGVLVFLPQIILLFLCLGLLEETGYLARAVFIMDRLMRPFGLNGKSVVPLISSFACAIPGIMATRTIPNRKERLLTILVAPLMSCSARIPVYTLLIALVIPNRQVFGFLNVQGLVLFGLYSLGIVSALLLAAVFGGMIKTNEPRFFLLEMPEFKAPRWKNIWLNLYEKSKVFVLEAGKVILIISILLWALASYGPPGRIDSAVTQLELKKDKMEPEIYEQHLATVKLENSFMGILGKSIEPVIRPLGFDWKMGISLLTSFAAREVFVGSMATIYSVHQEDQSGLLTTMKREQYPDGTHVYTLASGLSLMVFYVYAMQCMATLAVVRRETKSWKWPLMQVAYMGILAYLASLLVYNLLK